MSGDIKAGRGTLIGNSGEHYVMAELLKRNVIAALAPRNAPGFDILATKGGKTARIRVKTKSAAYDIWQWSAKPDDTIFPHLYPGSDFTVLVNLSMDRGQLAFFIVPTAQVDAWLRAGYERWVKAPGKNGHVHNPANRKRHLPAEVFDNEWQNCRENWDQLWTD